MELKDYSSLNSVTVERSELLGVLKENKKRHDLIFDAAVSGYYEAVQTELLKKADQAAKLIEEYKEKEQIVVNEKKFDATFKSSFNPTYFEAKFPENHSTDYGRVIRMLELSVHSKFTLDNAEFDQYVMNNWAWRKSFLSSTVGYLGAVTGVLNNNHTYAHMVCSGMNAF